MSYNYKISPISENYYLIEINLKTVFLINFSINASEHEAHIAAHSFVQGIKFIENEPLDFIPYEQINN